MKQNFSQWFSSLLKPERRQHPVSLLIAAIALLSGVTGWSQCTTAPPIAGASNVTATTAKLNWSVPADATSPTYTVQVSTDAAFTTLFANQAALNSTSYAVSGLTTGTTYYFRVKVDNTVCGDFGTGNFVAQFGYTPLDVTGFNADVIANGPGPAASSSTHTIDSSTNNNAYFSRDFKPLPTSPNLTYGLPIDRALNSANPTGLKFILQNYSGNNALRLPNTNDFGSLTFTEPQKLTNLYLAAASGDSESTISIEIQFSDAGPSQTVTGQAVTNWDSAPTAPITILTTGIGRVNRNDNAVSNSSNNFRIFQIGVTIDPANHNRAVSAVKITKTGPGTDSRIPSIFGLSGKSTPACPAVNLSATTAPTFTSVTFNWALASLGTGGATSATYTLEVATDANFTSPVAGSPFTNITGTSQVVTGLSIDTPYFYRVRATGGTCVGEYTSGTYNHIYCVPTSGSGTSNTITNFTTTGGYLNINNTTGGAVYTNYSSQMVAKEAGTSFTFNGTKSVNATRVKIYVDWNKDLNFDETTEAVYTLGTFNATTFSGTVAVPAGTPNGYYRMRVRSAGATISNTCGNTTSGETEDYTLMVGAQPSNCATPVTPTAALSNITATGMTVTTSFTTAPSGYIIVRSTTPTLTSLPVNITAYAVGTPIAEGTVVYNGTAAAFTDFAASNTHYYYHIYGYNTGGLVCFGPIYGTGVTVDGTTCAKKVQNASASNITSNTATLNWSSVVGTNGTTASYTAEVYTDAGLTTLFNTYTTATTSQNITGIFPGTTYYYRVKATTTGCHNSDWSETSSFLAQNSYTSLGLTGFNADVVANGTGAARFSTNNAIDAVSFSYLSLDYERTSGVFHNQGLPISRTLSIATPPVPYLMQDYSSDNSLRIPAQNQVGTLTLTQPVKASDLYIALTSGSGGSTVSAKINFNDGTNQTATISLLDWTGGTTNAIITNIGRVTRADATGIPETTNAKVFNATVAITAANQGKTITSVEFTKTSTGATEPVPNIFGISAKIIDDCASIASVSALPAANTAEVSWTAGPGAATPTYTLEVYTDAAYTTHITGSPFTGITTLSYNLTGLAYSTHYYFRVKAINGNCTSVYSTGDFTTTCPLLPPTASAQQFCVASTVANLAATGDTGATLKWYADATSTTPLLSTASIATGTYYVTQTLGACESGKTSVSVSVTILSAPIAAAQTFCGGATVSQIVVTGTATGTTLLWSTTENGTPLAGTDLLVSGTYYVKQTIGSCTSTSTSVSITVNTVNAPTANTSQTFCSGATVAQLTATAATGATINWSLTQGGAALPATTALTTNTYYVTQTVGTCTSPAIAVNVVVNSTPAPSSATLTYCGATTVANLVANGGTGATFKWYNSVTAVTPLAATTNVTSGTYFVSQTMNSCEGPRLSVNLTVTILATPTVAATQTHCNNATVAQLTATGFPGATFVWSLTENGTALASTEPLTAGTYYVKQTHNGCTTGSASTVVTLTSVNAPTAAEQTYCSGATVAQLTATGATGATFIWSSSVNGQPLSGTTILNQGVYFVKQTVGSCTSTATPVTVNITTTAVPTANSQIVCTGSTVASLMASGEAGTTFTWYATQGGSPLASDTEVVAGTYFVTQTVNTCESAKVPVTVAISTVPAPIATAQTHCLSTTVADLTATALAGATLQWSLTEDGPALDATTELATGVYYVKQTLNGCQSTFTSIVVTINTIASPTASQLTFCPGATTSQLTATALPGALLKWSATEGGAPLTGTELLATQTYYVTQTLNGCESAATPVTVTINTVATPTAEATQQICQGASVGELNVTAAPGASLTWYANLNGNAINSATLALTGTYYVTQTLNGCTSEKFAIAVTVNAAPGIPTGDTTQGFALGDTLEDLNVNIVPGATVTWYILDNGSYIPVNATTELEDGATYYVSQSLNTCESGRLAITVSNSVSRDEFGIADLKVFPNPTRDIITVANNGIITRVAVVNIMGQTVIDRQVNAETVQIDLSDLAGGNYILQVQSEGAAATIKVIKY